jgi:prophage regulatory protein
VSSSATDNPSRILRLPAVMGRTGLRTTAIYAHIKAGTFPKPVRLGPKAVGWISAEIDSWIAERVQQRDGGAQ